MIKQCGAIIAAVAFDTNSKPPTAGILLARPNTDNRIFLSIDEIDTVVAWLQEIAKHVRSGDHLKILAAQAMAKSERSKDAADSAITTPPQSHEPKAMP